MDREFTLEIVRVTEFAAIAAAKLRGKGDEKLADQAAVDAMRSQLNLIKMQGTVVIGEGERDEAPMLYIGEKVGAGVGPQADIALDPLEGTTLCAKSMPNALAVIAVSESGGMLNAPDTYMDKIAIGPGYPKDIISIDASPAENVKSIAKGKDVKPHEIGVCILDRPRHSKHMEAVRSTGASVHLIQDGDVAGIIATTDPAVTDIDMYIGIGGGPEGVLAAAALSCYGGQIQTRLVLNKEESIRAKKMGITDLKRKYDIDDMIKGDVIFCATAITNGDLVDGIKDEKNFYEASTIALHKDGKINTTFKNRHLK